MKKLTFYLLSAFILLLAACGNNEEPSTEEATATEGEDNSEMTELEEENEELRRQLEEQDEEDGDEEVAVEETGEDDTNAETKGSEDTQSSEKAGNQDNKTEGDRSDLVFDINSPEVQAYINKNDNYDDEGNFVQDAISVGMTQSEIETLYGMHDFIIPSLSTEAAAIYENVAVVYEERGPYVAGTDSDIDPDYNRANRVLYFSNLPIDELLDTMGTPDSQLTNLMGTQNYIYEGDSSNDEWGTIVLSEHETSEGLRFGSLSVYDDEMVSNDDSTSNTANEGSYFGDEAQTEGFPVTLTEEDDNFIYDTLRNFIFSTYLNSLADYYNDVDNEILNLTEGNALQTVQENKESGYFQDYQNGTGDIVSIEQISENEYSVTVNRTFSHASSDGEQSTQVTYTVADIDGVLKISDF